MTKIFIEVVINSGAYVSASDRNKMLKKGFFNAGNFWHRNYRRRHFERGAFMRYRYTPRSKLYNRLKQKYLKHQRPLVFSGVSERLSKQHVVVASRNMARVRMSARALNFKPKNSKVDMRDEVTQISAQEHQILSNRMNNELASRLRTYNKTGRLRIR